MKPANKLRIKTLDKGWSDKDNVMLHACFQLLTDFVEKEGMHDNTDWNYNEDYRAAKNEIDELLGWWKERITEELNEEQYETDTKMLIRLVKIREYLWT